MTSARTLSNAPSSAGSQTDCEATARARYWLLTSLAVEGMKVVTSVWLSAAAMKPRRPAIVPVAFLSLSKIQILSVTDTP